MEREVRRLIGSFGVAGFLAALAAGVASGSSAELALLWAGVAAICGIAVGGLVAWMVWRS
ncbi:MAG TPA: hypothetical protein ENF73_02850 [Proteobacteria bacterium]|nr:hypothetical protein [Pseudomonadota bacterium]